MKKTLSVMSAILLAVMLVVCLAVAASAAENEIYVSGGATGDGSSANSPVGTLSAAASLVTATRNTVILCGNVTVNNTVVSAPAASYTLKSQGSAKLVVVGNLEFARTTNTITLDDLAISVAASGKYFSFDYSNFTIGDGVTVTYSSEFYTGITLLAGHNIPVTTKETAPVPGLYSCSDNVSITIAGGRWERFLGGNMRNDTYAPFSMMSGDMTVLVSGGTFDGKGDTGTYTGKANQIYDCFAFTGMNGVTGDVTATITGGTFGGSVFAVSRLGYGVGATKFTAPKITGDVTLNISGGTFNGNEITSMQRGIHAQALLRGNYTLTLGAGAQIKTGTLVSAVNTVSYADAAVPTYSRLINNNAANVTVKYFDYVNDVQQTVVDPIRIAFIGDSITEGTGSTDKPLEAYPTQMQTLLDGLTTEYEVGNYGIGSAGVLTTSGYYYNDTFAYSIAMEEFDPQIVFMALGTNDASIGMFTTGQQELFVTKYTALLEGFGNLASCNKVYVTTAFCRKTSNGSSDTRAMSGVIPYQRQVCAALDARYANDSSIDYQLVDTAILTFDDWVTGALPTADGLHPKAAGYTMVAQYLYNAMINGVCTLDDSFYLDTVYVKDGGTGNGATVQTATNNFSAALLRVKKTGGTIVLTGNLSTRDDIMLPIDMTGTLTIKGNTGNEIWYVGAADSVNSSGATVADVFSRCDLYSATVIDDLTLDTNYTRTLSPAFYCNFNDLTLGDGVKTVNVPGQEFFIFAGHLAYYDTRTTKVTVNNNFRYDTVAGVSSDKDVNITVNAGDYRAIIGGNRRYDADSTIGTYSGNMVITINGGTFSSVAADFLSSASGMNYVTGNCKMVINGGTFAGTVVAAQRIGGANPVIGFSEANNTGSVTLQVGRNAGTGLTVSERGSAATKLSTANSTLICYDVFTGYTASDFDTLTILAVEGNGDADGDGILAVNDALVVLKYLNSWNVSINTANADINGDGKVGLADVLWILRAIARAEQ